MCTAMFRTLMALLPLLLVVPLFSGCAVLSDVYGDGSYPDRRYPDRRYPDRRYPDRRISRGDVQRDARSYADVLDRSLRLSNRQEQDIRELLEYRTYDLLNDARHPERVYPFPRGSHQSRDVEKWWSRTDRAVDRYLSNHQRREHRHLLGRSDRDYDRRDHKVKRRHHRGDDDDD